MSLDAALLRAASGLGLAARQMALASQNIANAGVEGYTRKQAPGEQLGSGGVRATEARRDVDAALRAQARAAGGEAAALRLRADILGPLAQLQGTPADGRSLGGLVGALRDGFVALRASPNDGIAQGSALRRAEELAGKLNALGEAVTTARQAAQDGARGDVAAANGLLRDVARLDAQLRGERAAGRLGDELRDRRDVAVGKLSTLLGATPVEGADGGLQIILGGSVLPLDEHASPLRLDDAVVSPGAPRAALPALTLDGRSLAAGGRIGAALELRDVTLARMGAELDTLATTLSTRFQEQGLTLFTGADAAPGAALRIAVNPAVIAAPAALRDGTADVPAFPPNPDGTAGYTGLLDRVLGFTFGERRNATTPHPPIPGGGLGPDGDLASSFAPPPRLGDYAAAVTAAQAGESGAAAVQAADGEGVADRLGALVAAREGVDVDAEMAAMVTLQNSYAANARVMAAVQGMWDALLAAVR